MSRTWQNQFPADFKPPDQILHWVASQTLFIDSSWGNDVCPSFTAALADIATDACVRLWVDHEDPNQREVGLARYAVVIYPEGCDHILRIPAYQGDDVEMAIEAAGWTVRMASTVFRELRDMQAAGRLPTTVTGYCDVHDYCDGNVLGDFEAGCEHFQQKFGHLNCEERGQEFDAARDIFFPICTAVHCLMDWWIKQTVSQR
jgi:hypothetical protein